MHFFNKQVILGAIVLAIAGTSVQAGVIYENDFENPGDPLLEWSNPSTEVTPGTPQHPADRFLGRFYNGTNTLTLENLPTHTELTVSFDVYIINTWDGNGLPAPSTVDPDYWELSVGGGETLLYTTFSNNVMANQAYPDEYPGGDHSPQTGADEIDTLGYSPPYAGDAVYTMAFTFSHVGDTLQLNFSAYDLDSGIEDESWGLDNIVVTPEPATLSLLALGGLALLRRRRS